MGLHHSLKARFFTKSAARRGNTGNVIRSTAAKHRQNTSEVESEKDENQPHLNLVTRRKVFIFGSTAGLAAINSPNAEAVGVPLTTDDKGVRFGVAALDNGARLYTNQFPDSLLTRSVIEPSVHAPRGMGTYAQSEIAFNVRDYGVKGDGSDETIKIQAAINSAAIRGGALLFPPGEYRTGPLLINRPIRISVASADSALFRARSTDDTGNAIPWGGVQLTRTGSSLDPLITIDSHAVTIEGLSLYGSSAAADGILVRSGFELRLARVRTVQHGGAGLRINRSNNAVFHNVMIDKCGSLDSPAVVINSIGEGNTNTLDFTSLTIERSRGTALQLGRGPDSSEHWAEYIRFSQLHIENSTDSGGFANPLSTPVVDIGNVKGISFFDSLILGGPGPLMQFSPTVSTGGITLVGGCYTGQYPGVTDSTGLLVDTPTLFRLKGPGDQFRMVGVSLQRHTAQAVEIAPEFGSNVFADSSTEYISQNGLFLDRRTDGKSPSVYITHGRAKFPSTVEMVGELQLKDRIRYTQPYGLTLFANESDAPTPVASNREGSWLISVSKPSMANDSRGMILFGTGAVPKAGLQLTIVFSRAFAMKPYVLLTPANKATADLGLYVSGYGDRIQVLSSNIPAPNKPVQTYLFNYFALT